MLEPLQVDSSRLRDAGNTLRDQVFPEPPAPISAVGTDSVSAAINETMPVIESPVLDGLPAVKAALGRTGSNIAAAADLYAETDQILGEHVGAVQFAAASERKAGGVPDGTADRLLAGKDDKSKDDKSKDDKSGDDKKPTPKPKPAPVPDFNQISQIGQATQPFTQGMQGMMSNMQQLAGKGGNAGASPAQLADDTTKDKPSRDDEAQLVDATKKDGEAEQIADGAAAGDRAAGGAPVQPPAGARPETAGSTTQV